MDLITESSLLAFVILCRLTGKLLYEWLDQKSDEKLIIGVCMNMHYAMLGYFSRIQSAQFIVMGCCKQ
jgi:TRAP-type C4-dicarboxylate transport system permease large subunit